MAEYRQANHELADREADVYAESKRAAIHDFLATYTAS
jgi:hypothetical protein